MNVKMILEKKEIKEFEKLIRKAKKNCPIVYKELKQKRNFKIITSSHTNYDDAGVEKFKK